MHIRNNSCTHETRLVMECLNTPPLYHLCDMTHSYMQCMCECRDSFNNETGGVMGRYPNVPSPSSRVLMVKAPLRYQRVAPHRASPQHTASHCNTLEHAAEHCKALQHTATCCTTLHAITLEQGPYGEGTTKV